MSTLNFWFMGTKGALTVFTAGRLKPMSSRLRRCGLRSFLSGTYDNRFCEQLIKIGAAHVRRNVDVHYLQRAANIIKKACTGILAGVDHPVAEIAIDIISVGKIIDISMTVIVSAYIEEEIRLYSRFIK